MNRQPRNGMQMLLAECELVWFEGEGDAHGWDAFARIETIAAPAIDEAAPEPPEDAGG